MKISKLIKELQQVMMEEGDLDVVISADSGGNSYNDTEGAYSALYTEDRSESCVFDDEEEFNDYLENNVYEEHKPEMIEKLRKVAIVYC